MLETELELLPTLIADTAEPLPDIDDRTFGEFFDRVGSARVVLLDEASHGTSGLERARARIARLAHLRDGCLDPWAENPAIYGRNALLEGYARCEVGVVQMLKDLLQKQIDCFAEECDEWLDARANALLVKNAEAYYRVMYHG